MVIDGVRVQHRWAKVTSSFLTQVINSPTKGRWDGSQVVLASDRRRDTLHFNRWEMEWTGLSSNTFRGSVVGRRGHLYLVILVFCVKQKTNKQGGMELEL